MARDTLAAQKALGSYAAPISATAADVVWTPLVVADGFQTPIIDGKTFILVKNTNAGSTAHTVTFTSSPDQFGRSGDITAYSIAAGVTSIFGPFNQAGWQHTGNLWIDGNHAELSMAAITLP